MIMNMDFVNECAEQLNHFNSWLKSASIIVPIFIGVLFYNNWYWKRVSILKDATLPEEFKTFFERIPITHPYSPITYGKTIPWGILCLWKKVVARKNGIELKNTFIKSNSTFVRHGEILEFCFLLPSEGEYPLDLEVIQKNTKPIRLLSTSMPGAAALIIELKLRNPHVPWKIEENTKFGRRKMSL